MRVHNFNPGPAALPLPALERVRDELVDFHGTGMSLLEHSHRGPAYEAVHAECQALLRDLLAIPPSHRILLLQGGASLQFAMTPMNLLGGGTADYLLTGSWGEKALEEARIVGSARVAASTVPAEGRPTRVPIASELELDPGAAYVHVTSNETIEGVQWPELPDAGGVPLACDASSDVCSRAVDWSRVGLLYAGAQKNIGPAGLTVVVVDEALLDRAPDTVPRILRYATHAKGDSLVNTPPVAAVHVTCETLRWVRDEGGLAAVERRNREKADRLYGALDRLSGFYHVPVEPRSRSRMNVVFRLPEPELERRFVQEAAAEGLVGLAGHRSVGGIRASLYNAVGLDSVDALVGFAERFAAERG